MRTPVRPYVTVGIALAGAAVLVANPIVPAPADIRVPADGQPVELTAITMPPVLGAILLQIQRNQIIDAIEIRNGLTTGAILILNPLLATPGVLAAALAEDVQNGEFEAFPAAIVGQTGAIGLGITRSIEVALPPILASAVSNIANTVEVSLAFPGEAAAIGGTVIQVPLTLVNGVVEAGTAVVQTVVAGEFAQVPAVAAAGLATVVQETTSDVEDAVDQIGTSQTTSSDWSAATLRRHKTSARYMLRLAKAFKPRIPRPLSPGLSSVIPSRPSWAVECHRQSRRGCRSRHACHRAR